MGEREDRSQTGDDGKAAGTNAILTSSGGKLVDLIVSLLFRTLMVSYTK